MSNNDGNMVLGPGEGKMVPVPGHKITHKLLGADTDGAYSLLEIELTRDGPPQHIHKNEDEAFYILEGEIKMLMGERTFRMKAGEFAMVRRGTVHTWCRAEENPAKILALFNPPGFEQFFDDAVDLDVADTEAYVAKANALAEKYNMEIVGPPLEL